jgi:hypothetical protein
MNLRQGDAPPLLPIQQLRTTEYTDYESVAEFLGSTWDGVISKCHVSE